MRVPTESVKGKERGCLGTSQVDMGAGQASDAGVFPACCGGVLADRWLAAQLGICTLGPLSEFPPATT